MRDIGFRFLELLRWVRFFLRGYMLGSGVVGFVG